MSKLLSIAEKVINLALPFLGEIFSGAGTALLAGKKKDNQMEMTTEAENKAPENKEFFQKKRVGICVDLPLVTLVVALL